MIKTKTVKTRYGKLIVPVNDQYIGNALSKYGEWAQLEINFLKQIVKPGQTILICGANIGVQTIALSEHLGKNGHISSVEVHPEIFTILEKNVVTSHAKNVTLIHVGLADEEGSLNVPAFGESPVLNYGGFSIQGNEQTLNGSSVPLRTIDSLNLASCDMILLDIEGAELAALKGAENTLKVYQPIIYLETNSIDEGTPVFQFLTKRSYKLFLHSPPAFNPDNFLKNEDNQFFGPKCETSILAITESRLKDLKQVLEDAPNLVPTPSLDDFAKAYLEIPYFVCKLYWGESVQDLAETKSANRFLRMGNIKQEAVFKIPREYSPHILRLDVANIPGIIKIYSIKVSGSNNENQNVILNYASGQELADEAQMKDIVYYESGIGDMFISITKDPQIIIELPGYEKLPEQDLIVSMTLSWPHEFEAFSILPKLIKEKAVFSEDIQKVHDALNNKMELLEKDISVNFSNIQAEIFNGYSKFQNLADALIFETRKVKNDLEKIQKALKGSWQTVVERMQQTKHIKLIRDSGLFNAHFYLEHYPGIRQAGIDPIRHYLLQGWIEERNPSEKFNTHFYLSKNLDVAKSGINPLVHYIKFGRNEGRPPLPMG